MSAQPGEEEFECAICRDCYTNPCCIQPCQHVYCFDCLQTLCASSEPFCPQCRCYIEALISADHIEKRMSECYINCSDCKSPVLANMMKQHKSCCLAAQRMQTLLTQPTPVTLLGATSMPPNRDTFACPYCHKTNLLRDQLVDHCSKYHYGDLKQVVSAEDDLIQAVLLLTEKYAEP